MKHTIILLLIVINSISCFSQTINKNEISNSDIYNVGKHSKLFYDTKYTQISNITVNNNYAILYSEAKFSLYLFDIKNHLILDELNLKKSIKKIPEKHSVETEFVSAGKTIASLQLDYNPVNFSRMNFIDDTTVFVGVIFFKKHIEALFVSINDSNKINTILKNVPIFSGLKEKPKNKNIINAINDFKFSRIDFNVIYTDTSKMMFYIYESIEKYLNKNYSPKQNKLFLYNADFNKQTISLVKSDSNINSHTQSKYMFANNGKYIYEYLIKDDSIIIRNTNFKFIAGNKINEELKKYKLSGGGYFCYMVKNNFTKQIYLNIRKAEPIVKNERYKFVEHLFEIKFDKYNNRIRLQLVKRLTSTKRLRIYEISDNKIFFFYEYSKEKSIYISNLYNSDLEENITSPINLTYELNYNEAKEQIYIKPNKRNFVKVFGKIKENKKQYPTNTIKQLLESANKCIKEKNIAYRMIYLNAYYSEHLKLIYKDIDNGKFGRNMANFLETYSLKEEKKAIQKNNDIIKLLDTEKAKKINKKLYVINIENTEKYQKFIDFVKINGAWRFGYEYKKKNIDTK